MIATGPMCLRMTLPLDWTVSILQDAEEPMVGWVSHRYGSMEPTTTLVWREQLRVGDALETAFRPV